MKAKIIKRPLEAVGSDIKKAAWSSVIESFAILILGVLFIAWPDMMMKIVSYIVGVFFFVKGAYRIIVYFIEKGQEDFFDNRLLFGVISTLIGVTVLIMGEDIANVFRIIVGIFIIYESLVRINTAIKLHAAGINIWRYILALSIVVLLLGIFIIFNNVTTVIGWMMIISGIVGIVGDTLFIQQVNTIVDKLTK